MSTHHGKTIEKIIRRNGHSISKLAETIGVNRRSVYYWFNQRQLKPDLIIRIGKALDYDLSLVLTGVGLKPEDFTNVCSGSHQSEDTCDWKDKYIELLERYNELLLTASVRKRA